MMMTTQQKVAEYFGVSDSMVPLLDALFENCMSLGSFPDVIVKELKQLNMDYHTRVFDAGCGKGAVSIAVAKAFGCRVLGFDMYQPFIDNARNLAKQKEVRHLCTFVHSDLQVGLPEHETFDLVLFVSVGPVFGSLQDTLAQLSIVVKPGGYVLIDDAFRTSKNPIDFFGYEDCIGYDETIAQLTHRGNRIVSERLYTAQEMHLLHQKYLADISVRANQLKQQHPKLADDIQYFVTHESREQYILENYLTCATWIVQM